MNLAERADALTRVLIKYRDKPFDWAGANCIRLARAMAVEMGHEVPPVPLFRSPLGAKRALAKQGAATVEELLDKWFPRLSAPAFAMMGDLVSLPADPESAEGRMGLSAIGLVDGQGHLFAWHQDCECMTTIRMFEADTGAAWRLG